MIEQLFFFFLFNDCVLIPCRSPAEKNKTNSFSSFRVDLCDRVKSFSVASLVRGGSILLNMMRGGGRDQQDLVNEHPVERGY